MIKIRNLFLIILSLASVLFLTGCHQGVLDPIGTITAKEKHLLIDAVLLMLIVVVPVIIMALLFAWKYREGNTKAKYIPTWSHSNILEIIVWAIPCIIIAVLAVITWISSHKLDPYRPLDVSGKPITIQVIALEWKWLFIYPDQKIATINYLQIPVNTQIKFLITSDAPMNSFAIPQLASQIYAMAGMQTKLYAIANTIGETHGLSTNFSGNGFAGMSFPVKITTTEKFNQWVKSVKKSPEKLSMNVYNKLAQPSENNTAAYFSDPQKNLFNNVIMKYMMPMKKDMPGMKEMPGMEHMSNMEHQ